MKKKIFLSLVPIFSAVVFFHSANALTTRVTNDGGKTCHQACNDYMYCYVLGYNNYGTNTQVRADDWSYTRGLNPPPGTGVCGDYVKPEEFTYCRCCVEPRDGGWSAWSNWSECSATCGGGTQVATRTCDNPKPECSGKQCVGSNTKTQTCNIQPCETCEYISEVTAWGPCDAGLGIQFAEEWVISESSDGSCADVPTWRTCEVPCSVNIDYTCESMPFDCTGKCGEFFCWECLRCRL